MSHPTLRECAQRLLQAGLAFDAHLAHDDAYEETLAAIAADGQVRYRVYLRAAIATHPALGRDYHAAYSFGEVLEAKRHLDAIQRFFERDQRQFLTILDSHFATTAARTRVLVTVPMTVPVTSG